MRIFLHPIITFSAVFIIVETICFSNSKRCIRSLWKWSKVYQYWVSCVHISIKALLLFSELDDRSIQSSCLYILSSPKIKKWDRYQIFTILVIISCIYDVCHTSINYISPSIPVIKCIYWNLTCMNMLKYQNKKVWNVNINDKTIHKRVTGVDVRNVVSLYGLQLLQKL